MFRVEIEEFSFACNFYFVTKTSLIWSYITHLQENLKHDTYVCNKGKRNFQTVLQSCHE